MDRVPFFAITLLLVSCHAQIVFAQDDWLKGWREATVAIGVLDTARAKDSKTGKFIIKPNGDTSRVPYFKVIGTGVIVSNPDSSVKIPILLTAKHVFFMPEKGWHPSSVQLRFSWFSNRSVTEYLGIPFALRSERGKDRWFAHPEESVDLAVIPLLLSTEQAGRATVAPVTIDIFANENEVFEGASVLLFGYPGAVGTHYWTKPVMRHGVIAYVNPSDFNKQPILIDAMVFPGNSGGPVFTMPTGMIKDGSFSVGGRSAFLGIVSKAARQSVEVEKTASPFAISANDTSVTHFKSFDYMGLGVIEPAGRVRELLESIVK